VSCCSRSAEDPFDGRTLLELADPAAAPTGPRAPDAWLDAMRAGRFESAWRAADRVLESRASEDFDRAGVPFHLRAVWNGEPLAGRHVLVRCYHGLGDALQFARYVPRLATIARSVSVQAEGRLLGVLGSLRGVRELAELPPARDPPHEVAIEAMELPHAFRTTLASVPRDVPYLRADPARVAAARAELARERRPRVGIVATAGRWDPERSLSAGALALLAGIREVAWYDLAPEPERGAGPRGIRRFAESRRDDDPLATTAARIVALDLVITVDTMVAHLAGALAAPTWTLLRERCDWRWMTGRGDSPWYPTMRLHRQRRDGDWSAPVERVAAELRLVRTRGAGPSARRPTSS
jgi:hypothetical protein